jgi:hypothetical protein
MARPRPFAVYKGAKMIGIAAFFGSLFLFCLVFFPPMALAMFFVGIVWGTIMLVNPNWIRDLD